jgi:hypothetical protein
MRKIFGPPPVDDLDEEDVRRWSQYKRDDKPVYDEEDEE